VAYDGAVIRFYAIANRLLGKFVGEPDLVSGSSVVSEASLFTIGSGFVNAGLTEADAAPEPSTLSLFVVGILIVVGPLPPGVGKFQTEDFMNKAKRYLCGFAVLVGLFAIGSLMRSPESQLRGSILVAGHRAQHVVCAGDHQRHRRSRADCLSIKPCLDLPSAPQRGC